MSFSEQEPAFQVVSIAAFVLCGFMIIVTILRLSLWLFPPKHYDPNFTSRSLTGWTNTPKKLAWSETLIKVIENKKNVKKAI